MSLPQLGEDPEQERDCDGGDPVTACFKLLLTLLAENKAQAENSGERQGRLSPVTQHATVF